LFRGFTPVLVRSRALDVIWGAGVAASTVWEILKAAGVDPAPDRDTGPTWAAFLRSPAEAIVACDFVVVDLLGGSKAYVLTVIEHATRRVRALGAGRHLPPDGVGCRGGVASGR